MFECTGEAINEVMNSIHDALFIHDSETFQVVYVNKRMCEMYNCTSEQALSLDFNEFILGKPPYSILEAFQWIQKAKTEGDQIFEWISCKKTGETFWTEVALKLAEINKKSYIIAIVRDISERKKSDLLIKESEIYYRTIFENTGTATVIIEDDTTISLANSKFEELSGNTKSEIENKKSWKDYVVKEDLERMSEQHTKRRINGESVLKSYEFRFVDKNGNEKHILLKIDLIPNTKRSVASLLDITERKKGEIALCESELKYRTLIESATDSIMIVKDGLLRYVNNKLLEVSGYTEEELIGQPFINYVSQKDKETAIKNYNRRMAGDNTPIGYETGAILKDGTELPIDVTASVFEYFGEKAELVFLRDITERKSAEKKLYESEERYRLISTVSSDYMFSSIVHPDGTLELAWVAGAFEKITGYSFEEYKAIGGWWAIVHPDDAEKDRKDLADLYQNKKVVTEIRTVKKGGEVIWVRIYAQPIWDENKNCLASIYGAVQDINERKIAEEQTAKINLDLDKLVIERTSELAKTNINLEKEIAEKLKAEELIKHQLQEKEVLLKEIHHRVKNNMQVIISILNLQASFIKNKKIIELLQDSQSRIKTMALIHEKLYQSKDFSKIDFSEYITNLFKYLFISYKSPKQQVEYSLDTDPYPLSIDSIISLGLITNELVSNSFKYAFIGKINCRIEVSLKKFDEENLVLSIKDNGKGFPDGLDYKNTESLGLQLVCLLTEQIQGKLDVQSSEKGTSFLIIFPNQN